MKPIVTRTQVLQIHDWMLDLGLTDKQLKLYALIYGYSQDGMSRMRGTAISIARWLGCSRKHVRVLLRELEDRGLIAHEVIRHMDETFSLFWVVDSEAPKRMELAGRRRWFGSNLEVPTDSNPQVPIGSNLEVPTDRDSNIYSSGSNKKNNTTGKNNNDVVIQKKIVAVDPPTIQEVAEYCKAQGFADPAGFADFYVRYQTEAGWMTGKGSKRHQIDNWKLNVIAWGRYHKNEVFSEQAQPPQPERRRRTLTDEEFNKYFQ